MAKHTAATMAEMQGNLGTDKDSKGHKSAGKGVDKDV